MTSRSSLLRRAFVLVSIGAVALTGMPSAGASTDAATIDTYSTWDGTSTLQPFGHPDTSTYGQVITIPEGKRKVRWFTWYMSAGAVSGTLTFRGEVYKWDGTKATTPVAESAPMSLDFTAGDPTYKAAKLSVEGARVKAGKQYVLFATISKDYEETDPNVSTIWPVHTSDVLAGGNTVWINDAGDESLWTTQAWSGIPTYDMAFKAKLR
jgi:hypothetical protein